MNLYCDCYNKVLTFSIVKPCRWAFENDEGCPAVDDEDDWNCDPRKEDCGDIYAVRSHIRIIKLINA